jgi:C-terminal processing protease CtpA/Prc
MKKIITIVLCSFLFIKCASVEKHNAHLNDLISENDLKADTDFIYKKMQKMHPKLDWYITKEKLDYKFDSLKTTITKPMTSYEFYKKITPVICEVRQGHMYVYPSAKLLTNKETEALKKKGDGPLSQFDFEVYYDKLYVIKNKSYDKSIKVGTEVIAVNGVKSSDLIKEYSKYFTSDGFNKTLRDNFLGHRFSTVYTQHNGVKDSITYQFGFQDSSKKITIKRKVVDSTNIKNAKLVLTKDQKKAKKIKKDVFGYDDISKLYMRNLKFVEKDSSIAVMKINGFKNGDYKTFYKESFQKINKYNTKTLILDLRNNGGGRLNEISNLYSYLADADYKFVDKGEVVSKTSLFQADYFKGGGILSKALKVIAAPFYYPIVYFTVKKDTNGKYYSRIGSGEKKVDKNPFKGKVYVLINGGSFSASSIISSNLKGSKRAFFVGEETGGAYNGTVAGKMPIVELPKSKVKVKIGLLSCDPFYKTDIVGHGIYPDKEIIPTIENRILDIDPEMNWVLSQAK